MMTFCCTKKYKDLLKLTQHYNVQENITNKLFGINVRRKNMSTKHKLASKLATTITEQCTGSFN